jgi:hypothetical protein
MNMDEQLKTELGTLLEEYKALKTEIVSNLDSARQVATLTLTAVGILITAAPFIIQSQATVIFLIAPLLFYVLAWAQLRYIYLVLDMGTYLREVVVPNVQRLLKETHTRKEKGHDVSYIMSWELPGKGPSRLRPTRFLRLFFLPIAGANYGIPLLAAILSAGTFLILSYQNSQTISAVEWALIATEAVALLYSAFWGFQAELRR